MHERDLRDIQLFGRVAVISGSILMIITFIGLFIVLASGGTTEKSSLVTGSLTFITAIIMASALVGIGGELQRAHVRSVSTRLGLRLDWTALFIAMAISFGLGFWLSQALAIVSSLMLVGLVLIRRAVINVTTH